MGHKAWSGYDKDDMKQDEMEHGMDMVEPRRRSKRDNGFYGHVNSKSMMKNKRMVKIHGC